MHSAKEIIENEFRCNTSRPLTLRWLLPFGLMAELIIRYLLEFPRVWLHFRSGAIYLHFCKVASWNVTPRREISFRNRETGCGPNFAHRSAFSIQNFFFGTERGRRWKKTRSCSAHVQNCYFSRFEKGASIIHWVSIILPHFNLIIDHGTPELWPNLTLFEKLFFPRVPSIHKLLNTWGF